MEEQEYISVTCPFCKEEDFDLIGLKHHLTDHCEVYFNTEDIKMWLKQGT